MNKFFSNILSFIFLGFAFFLVLFLINPKRFLKRFFHGKNFSDYELSYNQLSVLNENETKSFSSYSVNEINAKLFSESLYIQKESISEYKVELYGNWNNNYPSVYTEGNTLRIICKPAITFSFGPRRIIVHVPEKASKLNDMNITGKSGSLNLENIETRNISTSITSGSIKIKSCKIENADFISASGSIYINDSKIINLNANATSGSFHFNGEFDSINSNLVSGSIHGTLEKPLSKDSSFNTTSGSIHLNMPEESSFKVSYKCTSGTFRNAFTGLSGAKKGSDIAGDGKIIIEANTTSGSITFDKN